MISLTIEHRFCRRIVTWMQVWVSCVRILHWVWIYIESVLSDHCGALTADADTDFVFWIITRDCGVASRFLNTYLESALRVSECRVTFRFWYFSAIFGQAHRTLICPRLKVRDRTLNWHTNSRKIIQTPYTLRFCTGSVTTMYFVYLWRSLESILMWIRHVDAVIRALGLIRPPNDDLIDGENVSCERVLELGPFVFSSEESGRDLLKAILNEFPSKIKPEAPAKTKWCRFQGCNALIVDSWPGDKSTHRVLAEPYFGFKFTGSYKEDELTWLRYRKRFWPLGDIFRFLQLPGKYVKSLIQEEFVHLLSPISERWPRVHDQFIVQKDL